MVHAGEIASRLLMHKFMLIIEQCDFLEIVSFVPSVTAYPIIHPLRIEEGFLA